MGELTLVEFLAFGKVRSALAGDRSAPDAGSCADADAAPPGRASGARGLASVRRCGDLRVSLREPSPVRECKDLLVPEPWIAADFCGDLRGSRKSRVFGYSPSSRTQSGPRISVALPSLSVTRSTSCCMRARIVEKSSATRGLVTFPPFSCGPDIDYPTAAIGSIRLGSSPLRR